MSDTRIYLPDMARSSQEARRNSLPPSGVHPLAVAIPVACFAWFLAAAALAFDTGYVSWLLVVMTLLASIFFGLMLGGGSLGHSVAAEERHWGGFGEFLRGDVSIYTGHMGGRDILWAIAAMPVIATLGATALFLCAVLTR